MQNFGTLRQPLMWFWIVVVRKEEQGNIPVRGYIAGRARLYSQKSAVILPEERGYMEEERGYIPGRAWLYFCNENSGHLCFCLQPRAGHALCSDQNWVTQIVAYLSCSASRNNWSEWNACASFGHCSQKGVATIDFFCKAQLQLAISVEILLS